MVEVTDQPSQTFFISYRRDDAAGSAGRLADTLRQGLGEGDTVLRDVDQMFEPGADFKQEIADAIARCDTVLAVIGPDWASITGIDGARRLEDEGDLVRLELLAALDHGIPVIPVLVDGATMPRKQELPAALAVIADRNAVELTDSRWKSDTGALIEALREHTREAAGEGTGALPIPPTPLLGRQRELAEVDRMLSEGVRLITLTGPGGIGKTRIALEAAARAEERFKRVVFCDLTALAGAELVLPAIARASGVGQTESGRLVEVVGRALGAFPTLLVLDNFEHVLDAGPAIVELLSAAAGLQTLITSRAALRVSGEHEQPIAPLAEADAIELFSERARSVRPDFDPGAEELAAIAEICKRLDGLPLAIELAAVRVRLLTPAAMLGHLEQRLALLTQGAHDLPERQQTVRATIDWSYQLLEPADRELLARMSVFAGGATLPAIVAVCAPGREEIEVIDRLQSLAENSLITAQTDPTGDERFRMLELIREFAHDCVTEEGELELLGRLHGEFFVTFAERHGPKLDSSDLVEAFALFDADYANIRQALSWARDTADEEVELGLLDWLADYWYFRGYYPESWPWFEHALKLSGPSPERRAALMRGAGNMRVRMGDITGARDLFQSSLEICERLGDLPGAAKSLSGLEGVFAKTEDYERADDAGSRAIEIVRELGDRRRLSFSISNAGYTAMQRGDLARARPMFEEAAEIARSLGDPEAISMAEQNLGLLLVFENDLESAGQISAVGLDRAVELREHLGILAGLVAFAAIDARHGDHDRAAQLLGLIDAELSLRDYVLDPVEDRLRDETLVQIAAEIGRERTEQATSEGAKQDLIQVATRTVAEYLADEH